MSEKGSARQRQRQTQRHRQTYTSKKSKCKGTGERGGTVVLIRNCLVKGIKLVDTAVEDQVWLQFSFAPRVMFGFCYIPPQDSEYYSHYSFAAIQEKIKVNPNLSFCVVGDLNARLGRRVRELPRLADFPDASSYTYPVPSPNDNATILSALCIEEKLLVIKNLKTLDKDFVSNKTYHKHSEWISELNICIVTLNFLKNISNFSVTHSDFLPSDHATAGVPHVLSNNVRRYERKSLGSNGSSTHTHTHTHTHSELQHELYFKKPPVQSGSGVLSRCWCRRGFFFR